MRWWGSPRHLERLGWQVSAVAGVRVEEGEQVRMLVIAERALVYRWQRLGARVPHLERCGVAGDCPNHYLRKNTNTRIYRLCYP